MRWKVVVDEKNEAAQEQTQMMNGAESAGVEDAGMVEAEAERLLTAEEQLAAARAEAARNLEGWQRAQAEFANARKRLEKQRVEAYTTANAELATRLLPIVDDFERALDNAPDGAEGKSWLTGVELVYRKLAGILEGMGVVPIEAVGQPFDPNLHEALGQENSNEHESGVVTREMQKGYRLGDRVIRPSIVYVSE
jgi:molecular chaperone GrpE